jgi:hypothetical protein
MARKIRDLCISNGHGLKSRKSFFATLEQALDDTDSGGNVFAP